MNFKSLTKKQIDHLLGWGRSHHVYGLDLALGVTKFQVFLAIKPMLKGKLYWYALKNAFQMSDNLYDYRFDVLDAFYCEEPNRDYLMNKSERQFLKKFNQKITIYRGMTQVEKESGNFGISWTLNKEMASFFANNYRRNFSTDKMSKTVHELTVDKCDVFAYLNEREEAEIIYIHNKKTL